MDFSEIKEAIEYGKDKVGTILVIITGLFVPGILTIYLFWRDLFVEIDILKLLILAVSISIPSFMIVLFFSGIWHTGNHDNNYILEGLGINIIVFGLAIYFKILCPEVINMKIFVQIVCSGAVLIDNAIHLLLKCIFSEKRIKAVVEKSLAKLKKENPEKYEELIKKIKEK